MTSERDLGLQALQTGDFNQAISHLENATRENSQDYEAHLYLGVSHGQAGRHNDSVTTLTQAVILQPANAQARFNLGLSMEQAGYPVQATEALQQALQLQPDYAKAQEALNRINGAATPNLAALGLVRASSSQGPVQSPLGTSPQVGSYAPAPAQSYSAPAPGSYAPPPNYAQPSQQQPAPLYGAPTQQQPVSLAGGQGMPNPNAGPYSQTVYVPPPAVQSNAGPGAIVLGIIFGGIGSLVGIGIWLAIAIWGHFFSGYAAFGVGWLTGTMTKLGTKESSKTSGIIAVVCCFLSTAVACLFVGLATQFQGTSFILSAVFGLLGVWYSYRVATN